MPLTMDNSGAALVAGAPLNSEAPRRVRVLRPFMAGGLVQDVGSEVQLPRLFAAEMAAAGKVEPLPDEPPAAVPAPAAKPAKAPKG